MVEIINTREEYDEMMIVIYNLMNKGESNLNSDELKKLEIMVTAAEQYENQIA